MADIYKTILIPIRGKKNGGINPSTAKRELIQKYGRTCNKCKRTYDTAYNLQVDHKIPIMCGGMDQQENTQLLCSQCHANKTIIDKIIINCLIRFNYLTGRISGTREMCVERQILHDFYLLHYPNIEKIRKEKQQWMSS